MALSRETKVGAFVVAGLLLAGFVIFLIGDERRLFDPKVAFHVQFNDVQGLKIGAPIRLGGIDIGTVGRVGHGAEAGDDRLYVELHVVKSEAIRIHQDTVAYVANKGLLGDKMIELKGGSPSSPLVPPDGEIKGQNPSDFSNLVSQVGTMTEHAQKILENLHTTTDSIAGKEVQDDLRTTVHSINIVMKSVAEGDGYVHKLLSDPQESERMSRTVANLDRAADELHQTLAETHQLVARVNHGPGFAHDVVYGEGGNQMLSQAGSAAGEIASTLKGMREGNGLAHTILYGGDPKSDEMVANISAMTGDLRHIVADVRAGKGTVGALLVDPSVYEDMKTILGNVERNDVLRALVRYSIKQDEKHPEVKVSPPAKGQASAQTP